MYYYCKLHQTLPQLRWSRNPVKLDSECWFWDPEMYDLRIMTFDYTFGKQPSCNWERFETPAKKAPGWNSELRNFYIRMCATDMTSARTYKVIHNLAQEACAMCFQWYSMISRASGSDLVIWMRIWCSHPLVLSSDTYRKAVIWRITW